MTRVFEKNINKYKGNESPKEKESDKLERR